MMKRLLIAIAILLLAACRKPNRGPELITQYGCTTCHTIPGVEGHGAIGPPLEGIGARPRISNDRVPNTQENLAKFIHEPASLNPSSSMPALNIPDADAQEIAEYLRTLK
jgi:cytochrome c2